MACILKKHPLRIAVSQEMFFLYNPNPKNSLQL